MKIIVDGREYEVWEQDQDKDLLTALLHLGFDVPYFCWHPALGSVGACRQCAIKTFKDENDTRGVRELLNLGHTFAHALESVTGYGHYTHGEAVSVGLCAAVRCAFRARFPGCWRAGWRLPRRPR